VARTSEKHHWERFWEESEQIDDVYDTDGRVVRALVEVLDPQGARILEVGAGSGRDSLELQRHGAMVAVVDYTPSALHLIRRQQAGDQLLPICGNAFQLPFADGVFDAVFHQGLLEHFRNPLDMVRENARVLKPGGVLLVDVDKIGAKIRDAQMQKVPYMLVLGDKELEEQTVAVRERKQGDIGAMSLEEFKGMITQQKLLRAL
jgi:ubiquinone/menaquinone biosynthesis C-methylase UbiE